MADGKTTEIVFDEQHKLQTRSTPERIESEIKGATNPWMPLIPVELPNGESAMVNAAQIRVIRPACARCNRGRR